MRRFEIGFQNIKKMEFPSYPIAKAADQSITDHIIYLHAWLAREGIAAQAAAAVMSARRHEPLDNMIDKFHMLDVMRQPAVKITAKQNMIMRYLRGEFDLGENKVSTEPTPPRHWLLRISDGEHFKRSYPFRIWGINSQFGAGGKLIREGRKGDVLWFVRAASGGLIAGAAIYSHAVERSVSQLTIAIYARILNRRTRFIATIQKKLRRIWPSCTPG